MPVPVSYPGVYIEEVPSGVRSIVGVPTSVTAFIGRASRGPVNAATTIYNLGDYQRQFGGLSQDSMMSYAVRDYYRNGGGEAVIVRLYRTNGGPDVADYSVDGNTVVAANEGKWGNSLKITVDDTIEQSVADDMGLQVSDLFNLFIEDQTSGATEEHRNLTIVAGPRNVTDVLAATSSLIRLPSPVSVPTAGDYIVTTSANDGDPLTIDEYNDPMQQFADDKLGLYALENADIFNLLCIPPDFTSDTYPGTLADDAIAYCDERNAIFIYDPPAGWATAADAKTGVGSILRHKNVALYFPRIRQPDPLHGNMLKTFAPCGVMAGVINRTDSERGLWKAPAGIDASLRGVSELAVPLTNGENGMLNQLGVNCLRSFPVAGRVSWGARTLKGADALASEWKYLPVRRTALFIKETLQRGLAWAVHEPNDEPLWAEIRLSIDGFMDSALFRQGALQGKTRREAYLVKCDAETTTQDDINKGIVNIVVGFAPLKPAEFVIVKLQQMAGQVA